MSEEMDFRVRDFGNSRLRLRDDLIFTPQTVGGRSGYVIEDPVNSKFFRIGTAEYVFVSLLNGQTTISEALRTTATARPDAALTEQEAAGICKWLIESQLAHTDESASTERLIEEADAERQRHGIGSFNPLFIRLPLFHPDRFFTSILSWTAWLFSTWVVIAWMALLVVATYQVVENWHHFTVASQGVFAPGNWIWLGLCWLALKFIHEIAHGVVCRKYGGTVREAGAILVLLSPMAYVDVTSSWKFRSKWHRIFTATAGMYIEILLASVAALLWCGSTPGVLSNIYFNIIVMAGITTVAFNANPLMRFDGYYILSDLFELPNLYSKGQQYVKYWGRRYLMGIEAKAPTLDSRPGMTIFIRCYAIASLFWRVTVSACLIVVASTLFHGAGVVIAAFAVVAWIVRPAMKFVKYIIHGAPGEQPNRLRFVLSAISVGIVGYLLLAVAPWPGLHRAEAVAQYASLSVVRADSDGFVREIHVRGDESVKAGHILAVLENDELHLQLAKLKIEIEKSIIISRQHQQKNELASYQAELSHLTALKKQRHEIQTQVDNLTLRAPRDGKVIGRNLDSLLGVFIEQGTEILSIGQEEKKELRISIAQDDLDVFTARTGQPVKIRLSGHSRFASQLVEIQPQASLRLPHTSLAAPFGGALPVREKTTDKASTTDGTSDAYEFLAPRFTGLVALDSTRAKNLGAGQRGYISFRSTQRTIGDHLYQWISHWIRDKLQSRSE